MAEPTAAAVRTTLVRHSEARLRQALQDLIEGRGLSIPARPDHDADLILDVAINELVELREAVDWRSGHVEALEKNWEALHAAALRERDEERARADRAEASLRAAIRAAGAVVQEARHHALMPWLRAKLDELERVTTIPRTKNCDVREKLSLFYCPDHEYAECPTPAGSGRAVSQEGLVDELAALSPVGPAAALVEVAAGSSLCCDVHPDSQLHCTRPKDHAGDHHHVPERDHERLVSWAKSTP